MTFIAKPAHMFFDTSFFAAVERIQTAYEEYNKLKFAGSRDDGNKDDPRVDATIDILFKALEDNATNMAALVKPFMQAIVLDRVLGSIIEQINNDTIQSLSGDEDAQTRYWQVVGQAEEVRRVTASIADTIRNVNHFDPNIAVEVLTEEKRRRSDEGKFNSDPEWAKNAPWAMSAEEFARRKQLEEVGDCNCPACTQNRDSSHALMTLLRVLAARGKAS